MIRLVILIESFMVLSIIAIINRRVMREISLENFILMFLCILVIESAIALVISLSLCKRTSGDFLDLLFFY